MIGGTHRPSTWIVQSLSSDGNSGGSEIDTDGSTVPDGGGVDSFGGVEVVVGADGWTPDSPGELDGSGIVVGTRVGIVVGTMTRD
jgi:hypothetical protein